MENKNPHPDVQRLLEAAQFLTEKCREGGEIYFVYKPGEKGRLDLKVYGFTSGATLQ